VADVADTAGADGQTGLSTDQLPSTYVGAPWIWCEARGYAESLLPDPGKWMLFVPVEQVDAVWQRVSAAIRADKLGPLSKVATAWPNPNARDPSRRAIMIYSGDWNDEDDVRRVLCGLRDLGFEGKLSYKTDATTLAGSYGRGVATYISDAGSRTFRPAAAKLAAQQEPLF